jgi:hypothetical protein
VSVLTKQEILLLKGTKQQLSVYDKGRFFHDSLAFQFRTCSVTEGTYEKIYKQDA